MQDYHAQVAEILDRVYASALVGADRAEEGKAQLARRAAYEIHQINRNIGLLKKDSGNNVGGLSVDVFLDKSDGSWADMASDAATGNANIREVTTPWTAHNNPSESISVDRWVEPTLALANQPGPLVLVQSTPDPGPDPTPPATGPILVVFRVLSPEGVPLEAILRATNQPFGNWAGLTCERCGLFPATLAPSTYRIRVEADGFDPELNTADYDLRRDEIRTIIVR